MADNTELNLGTGGDVIRTDELIDEETNTAVAKAQVVKLMLGSDGVDGGLIGADNPLPVNDREVVKLLERACGLLEDIKELLEDIK